MRRRVFTARIALPAAINLLASTGVCRAQCDIFREGIPDFDQERTALPNNGLDYCVPTTICNLLGYISNNGDRYLMGGPFNWQLQELYDYVTDQIESVASYVHTDPNTGTTNENLLSGLQSLLDDRTPDTFSVTATYGFIHPIDLFDHMGDGRMVMICYGYYQPDSMGNYSRNDGHCVALTGLIGACSSPVVRIRYRDPDDDPDQTSQSNFSSSVGTAISSQLQTSSGPIQRWRFTNFSVSTGTLPCLDKVISIRSTYALWPSPVMGNWIRYEVLPPTHVQGGVVNQYTTGNGRPAVNTALSPDGVWMYYTTASESQVADIIPVYRQSLSDGTSTRLMTLVGASPLAFDRFGDLYMYNAGLIERFDTSGSALVQLASAPTNDGLVPDALAWDDTNDQLVAVSQSARRLDLFNRDLTVAGGGFLSRQVTLHGQFRADVAPGGTDYIVGSTGAGAIYDLKFNAGQPGPLVAQTFTIAGASSVQAVQIGTHGRLYVLTDVGEREFVRDAVSGLWGPAATPQFGNLPASNALLISRGRTNYDPALYGSPGWLDRLHPSPGVAGAPDCAADQNLDGLLTVQDIFVFLQRWFSNDRAGDFNESGSITIQDIFDFLAAWFHGC